MKRIMPIILIIFLFMAVPFASADIQQDTSKLDIDMKDTYLINDTMNFEGTFKIKNKNPNHQIYTFIDYDNIDERSGGYIEEDDEYLLPHDLGLGKHKLHFIVKDKNGKVIHKETRSFYVTKYLDDDKSMYDGFTPYSYDGNLDDERIDEDYQEWLQISLLNDDEIDIEETEEDDFDFFINEIYEPWEDIFCFISLGDIDMNTDDSLTSQEIEVSF